MSQKVFISYRRETASWPAKQIRRALIEVLPAEDVFMDIDSIPIGKDFETTLKEWVAQCGTMLAIIDDKWLNVADKKGNRRINNKGDYVRIEIAAGLARGIPVVPVLLDGAAMPTAAELPAALKGLRKRQAIRINLHSDEADIAVLLRKLGLGPAGADDDDKPPPPPVDKQPADTKPTPEPTNVVAPPQPFKAGPVSFSITPLAQVTPPAPFQPSAAAQPAPSPHVPPAPSPSVPAQPASVTAVTPKGSWSYEQQETSRLATTGAFVVALSTPIVTVTALNAFEAYGWDALAIDQNFAYQGARATGTTVAALPYLAFFVASMIRNRPGVAAAFYWIAAAQAVVVACINIALARFWSSPDQYYVNDFLDLNVGAWVGFLVAAAMALILIIRQPRLTPASVATVWVGLAGAGGLSLATATKAWSWAWITTATGDGSMVAGILLGVVCALVSGATLAFLPRAKMKAGELLIYLGGGLVAAAAFGFPVYMIVYPGYSADSPTPYIWTAIAASALLLLAWFLLLLRARGRRPSR